MRQPLKVINFEQNISDTKSHSTENNSPNAKSNFSITKLLVLVNFIFTLSVGALYVLHIEIIQEYRIEFLLTVVSFISLSTFTLGSISNKEKSYKLKLIKNQDSKNTSPEILLNDSIIPYFQLTPDGNFICSNKSFSSLLNIVPDSHRESTSSLNFFSDFVKNVKIKKHIILKLENKGRLENYRLRLSNQKGKEIYVSMSCKFLEDSKTLEGSLTDITSQYLKEKSISEEIERLKTEVLISQNESKKESEIKNGVTTSQLIHDLKSPLNSIFGFLTLIENQHYETEDELTEFTKNAKIAGEQLLQTIDKKFEIERTENDTPKVNELPPIENNTPVEIKETTINTSSDFTITDFDVQTNSGPNLLLVEDNLMNQQVEIKLLEKVGYNVFAVESGEEAIEQVKTNKFDLVLMDIELTGMSGLEATKEIRNISQDLDLKNIPIIAATAKSSMKDRERCLQAGMNDYISKPINISFMKMTIDQWLKQNVNYK